MDHWQQQSRQRFAILALVSLGLHLPLLMTFNKPEVLPVTNAANSMSVRLIDDKMGDDAATPPDSASPAQSNQPKTAPKTLSTSSQTIHDKKSVTEPRQPEPILTEQVHQGRQDDTPRRQKKNTQQQPQIVEVKQPAARATTNKARVVHRLQQDIPNYFYYPSLARRYGYQGTVTLVVELHRQGYIAEIRILKSSGHRILDLAAKDAVSQMAVSWASDLVHEPSVQIELPVQYILTES